jgi:hypothetical protein
MLAASFAEFISETRVCVCVCVCVCERARAGACACMRETIVSSYGLCVKYRPNLITLFTDVLTNVFMSDPENISQFSKSMVRHGLIM